VAKTQNLVNKSKRSSELNCFGGRTQVDFVGVENGTEEEMVCSLVGEAGGEEAFSAPDFCCIRGDKMDEPDGCAAADSCFWFKILNNCSAALVQRDNLRCD